MLDEVLKRQLLKEFDETIRGLSIDEAKEAKAGEIYSKTTHLKQAQHMLERLNDEITELRKIDVEAELKKEA